MPAVLLSLHPEYVERVLRGVKRYEFRRRRMAVAPDRALLYATRPVGEVLGLARIARVLSGTPQTIWRDCADGAGEDEQAFFEYFAGASVAHALEIADVRGFVPGIPRQGLAGLVRIPQSFCYVSTEILGRICAMRGLDPDLRPSSPGGDGR